MMKIKKSAPVTFFLLTSATGICAATVAHYGEIWVVAYGVAVAGGFASAFAAIVAGDE